MRGLFSWVRGVGKAAIHARDLATGQRKHHAHHPEAVVLMAGTALHCSRGEMMQFARAFGRPARAEEACTPSCSTSARNRATRRPPGFVRARDPGSHAWSRRAGALRPAAPWTD